MRGTAPSADPNSASYKSFADTYKDKFGHDRIPPFTATTYDAAVVIGLAIAKAAADGLSTNEITGNTLAERLRPVANPPGETIIGGNQGATTKHPGPIKEGKALDYAGERKRDGE